MPNRTFLRFDGYRRESDKLAPLCTTSRPTSMLIGVREGESEVERVLEGDRQGVVSRFKQG